MSLSVKSIPVLLRDGARQIDTHHDAKGLYLQITENGASWLQRVTWQTSLDGVRQLSFIFVG